MRGLTGNLRTKIVLAALAAALPSLALAHSADRGFVLLLPTGHYMIGGAIAVALSFVVLVFAPAGPLATAWEKALPMARAPRRGRTAVSFAGFALFWLLVAAGFFGSGDPLSNPLPLVFWTPFWVGLTMIQGLLGDAWRWINPWYGPYRLVSRLTGPAAPLALPRWMSCWPAVALLFGFAWFELVYPAPDDPARLAVVLAVYWLVSFAGMLLFGYEAWADRVEFLSVFFGIVARLSILDRDGDSGRIALRLPGGKLADAGWLPPAGTLFLLLALSTVSFDGLMRTFFWAGIAGYNPLEYPGRTAVMASSTLGLAAMFIALSAAFLVAVWIGGRMSGDRVGLAEAAGQLVWSIVPIALAYHFSHYLAAFLVDGQYALAAISDPLSTGLNLFGTAGFHVYAGILAGPNAAWVIWNLQAVAIVGGHILAVLISHIIAYRIHSTPDRAAIGQIPLAVLMVLYTLFGLWLLASPTV